jgi:hypothetical protein
VLGGLLGCVCASLVAPVQAAFAVTVTTGTISSVEGAQFSGPVGSFSDLGLVGCQALSSYTATVAWGDDHTTSTATLGTPSETGLTCTYPLAASHRFDTVGNGQTFTVSVTGSLGSDSATGTANVSPAPLSSKPVQIAAVEGASFTATVATFADAFTGRPASHYTATVDWGDGSGTATGTVVPVADGSFEVAASHTYTNVGTYTTTVAISDPDGSRTTATSTTTVTAAALSSTGVANTATEGQPFAATIAKFADAYAGRPASRYTATVDWGDGSPTTTPTVVADPAGGFDVNAGHTYANYGTYMTTVTISDPEGSQTTAVGRTDVADAALNSSGLGITGVAGQPITALLATFTDADPGRPASHYTATIDWGDGSSTSASGIVADAEDQDFDVAGSHTYASAGSYPTTITISDPGGSQTVAVSTAHIAAPPPPPPPPTPPAPPATGTPTTTDATPAPSTAPVSTPAPTPAKTTVVGILPTPKVSLTSPRLSGSKTTISIAVGCPAGQASCQGVVRLTTLPAASSKIAALRRGTTIGSVLFVLHPGQSKTFSVHIASKILHLLRDAGTARVQGVAVAFGKTGSATSSGAVARIATAAPKPR